MAIQDEQPYVEMSLEQLVEINPDVLLLANNEGKLLTDEWKENPLWKDLKAVKMTRFIVLIEIYGQDSEELFRQKLLLKTR